MRTAMPVQHSLFPDEFELKAQALAALRALEVPKGLALVRRVRRSGARLPDLEALEEALRWMAPRLQPVPTLPRLGALLEAVAADGLAGRLSRTAAEFADNAVARFVAAHCPEEQPFLDPDERVPRALATLILGHGAGARRALFAAIDCGHRDRGDLWGYIGDACILDKRPDEVAACYARALLFTPERVDLWRVREPRLPACHAELRQHHPEAAARALLLAQAWLAGAIAIPPGNGWLEPAELDRLLASHDAGPGAPVEARCRRFGLLLYRDRSRRRGEVEVQRREEMAALLPELFAQFVRRCRDDEHAGPPRRQ